MPRRHGDHIPMLSDTGQERNRGFDMSSIAITTPSRSSSMVIPPSGATSYEADDGFVPDNAAGPPWVRSEVALVPMSNPLSSIQVQQLGDESTPRRRQGRNVYPPLPPVQRDDGVWRGGWIGASGRNLFRSGPLGACSDPYCTTCPPPPAYYMNTVPNNRNRYSNSHSAERKVHGIIYDDAKGWARKFISSLSTCFPVMNPHARFVQKWNRFFVISCLVAIFIDPLFFFILSVDKKHKCIVFNWKFAAAIAAVRSITDFIYILHMLFQFRLAFIAPETRVVGAGDIVDDSKKIALHYLNGYFLFDFFNALPLPQVMILIVIPKYIGSSEANFAKNLLRVTVLLQYVPRIIRFFPLLVGQSSSGFTFESAWANFVINLLMFVLAGHVVGSCWYLFGLQRVNQCLKNACIARNYTDCAVLIDCGRAENQERLDTSVFRKNWSIDANALTCMTSKAEDFDYGIYGQATIITSKGSIIVRYVYSLFWGFQQISTLAGNQVPSAFVGEVLFTMGIVGLGLLLFALLIGNMQNFLLALGRRRLDMQLRRRDVEQWMNHRRFPENLKTHVREAERLNWVSTRGANEESLLENLPEDLQRSVRRHLFKFLEKIHAFTLMDEPLLESVREKLRQNFYVKGSDILYHGGPIDKMVFVVRGTIESTDTDGNKTSLSVGGVCGEELLTWYLENSSTNRDGGRFRVAGRKLLSNRKVSCLTNVEAFTLRVTDLEDISALFSRFLRNPHVQGAIRYESSYWRTLAATKIQVAWRYRKKRLLRLQGLPSW